MGYGAPCASPGMQTNARQAECGWNQSSRRLAVGTKRLAIEEQLGVELSRSPTGQNLLYGCDICAQNVSYWQQVRCERDNLPDIEVLVGPAVETMTDDSRRNAWSAE